MRRKSSQIRKEMGCTILSGYNKERGGYHQGRMRRALFAGGLL